MRQVPSYLIIGNGRVARHFKCYFNLLQIPYKVWHRGLDEKQLFSLIEQATHILLLISDGAISAFAKQISLYSSNYLIHFSGSLTCEKAWGVHPLFTFNTAPYTLDQYQSIPFIVETEAPDWQSLLPGLPNRHVRLSRALKAKYHALCVLGGNFSSVLWQKVFESFEHEFHLPKDIAFPYLQQLTQNLIMDSSSALTGPLVRNDHLTIQNNIAALASDPFQKIYKSFVECYQTITTGDQS